MAVKSAGSSTYSPVSSPPAGPEVKDVDQGKKSTGSASTEASETASTPGPASTESQKSEKKLQEQTKSASLFTQLSDGATALMDKATAMYKEAQKPVQQGDNGPAVKAYQEKLNSWRTDKGKTPIKADGNFGEKTDTAVREFQKANGLKQDGILGPETRDRLLLETDPNFKTLKPEDKESTRTVMKRYANKPDARAKVLLMATDPDFKFVSEKAKPEVLIWTAESENPEEMAGVRDYVKTSATMESDPNFKALNDNTKDKLRTLRDSFSGDSDISKGILQFAQDQGFKNLNPAHQEAALKAFEQNLDPAYAKELTGLVGSQDFQKLDDGLKTKILDQAQSRSSIVYASDAKEIIASDAFGKMTLKQKEMTFNVVEELTPGGRTSLIDTMKRDVYGTPAILSKGYGNTGTLLDQLDRLASSNLDPRMTDASGQPISKQQVLGDLLDEVGDPYTNINQNNRGTCSVTSMTHKLALQQPAEYARLVTDLATTGKAKLANGDTLQVPSPDVFQSDNSTRSDGERLLQASLMAYARPGVAYQNWSPGADGVRGTADDGQFDPTNPTAVSLDGFADRPESGLMPDEMARVLKGLHGQDYNVYTGSLNFRNDKGDIIRMTEKLIQDGKGPVVAGITWGPSGHAVEITDVRDGKVFYRNPWGGNNVGPTGSVNGTKANNSSAGPLRTTENGGAAIESMALEDFQAAVQDILMPVY